MINISQPSVMSLIITMKYNGQNLGTGTGFIIETSIGPCLVTNRHNVTGRNQDTGEILCSKGGIPNEISIMHNAEIELGKWILKTEKLYIDEKPCWFEHPILKQKADFVFLPLRELRDVKLYPYEIKSDPVLNLGPTEMINVVGFPFGLSAGKRFAIWVTGFIASEIDINYDNLPIFLIDCRSRKGQSGSPVIAFRNGGFTKNVDGSLNLSTGSNFYLVGIYSGRINEESDLGRVWKISALKELQDSLENPQHTIHPH